MTTRELNIEAQRRFAAALVIDPRLFLEAQRDPHTVAARYGATLTEQQIDTLRTMDPEAVERMRERLVGMASEERQKTEAFLDQGGTPGW